MKGIVLAGGLGSRLFPITISVSKQLMPVYDKPMIYYPMSTLISIGIKDILIICNPRDIDLFKNLLGDGSQYGCYFKYATQSNPNGIADAFLIGHDFIGKDQVTLILGDNIFYFPSISERIQFNQVSKGAHIFAYHVSDPSRYGVVEFDNNNQVLSIEEKPKEPKTNYAIPGLYIFDQKVTEYVTRLKPSLRGELEITDLLQIYLEENSLNVMKMDKGTAWLDTGTFSSLMQASQFVQVLEKRQGLKVGCIEEVAYKKGYINNKQLLELADKYSNSGYGKYLISLINE
tara:strand:+ start:531 stop:1394 length:864 start_codon:yes stop_codon:yes gene_type:complete